MLIQCEAIGLALDSAIVGNAREIAKLARTEIAGLPISSRIVQGISNHTIAESMSTPCAMACPLLDRTRTETYA